MQHTSTCSCDVGSHDGYTLMQVGEAEKIEWLIASCTALVRPLRLIVLSYLEKHLPKDQAPYMRKATALRCDSAMSQCRQALEVGQSGENCPSLLVCAWILVKA